MEGYFYTYKVFLPMINVTKSDVTYFDITQQANLHIIYGNEITITRTYVLYCIGM